MAEQASSAFGNASSISTRSEIYQYSPLNIIFILVIYFGLFIIGGEI